MITWFAANGGTMLVSLVLAAGVSRIIVCLRKAKAQGKSTCGGNCAHCKGGCSCH